MNTFRRVHLMVGVMGSVAVAVGIAAGSFAALVPTNAKADAPFYYATATAAVVGTTVTINGAASAQNYAGLQSAQQIAVNWDDGSGWHTVVSSGGLNFVGNNIATTTFSTSNTFATSGSYTIQVGIYHAQPTGNEGGLNTVTFDVTIPTTGGLKVIKTVSGGTKSASEFNIHVKSATTSLDVNGSPQAGSTSGTEYVLGPGGYVVSEDADSSYTATFSGACDSSGNVTVSLNATSTCTITNTFSAPTTGTLHIVKNLITDNGGTATKGSFSFQVDRGSATAFEADGQNDLTLTAGTYSVTEVEAPGYTTTYNNCTDINLIAGGEAICTITNDDIAPTITVHKTVVKLLGDATEASFTYLLDAITQLFHNTAATTTAGAHTVSESPFEGYTASAWTGDCASGGSITLTLGQNANCSITNTENAPTSGTVTVTKVVDNLTWGGTASVGDFALTLTASTTATTSITSGVPVSLLGGIYVFSETGHTAGYVASFSGGCDSVNVTVTAGTSTSCTVTNTALPAKLTVTKIVINNSGTGTATTSDFVLTVGGSSTTTVTSGEQNDFVAGFYTITEPGSSGYSATFSGDCATDGSITIQNGGTYSCTITNDDLPRGQGTLTIEANAAGGNSTFSFDVSGLTPTSTSVTTSGGSGSSGDIVVDAGTYSITATFPSDWTNVTTEPVCTDGSSTLTGNIASGIVVGASEHITCTFSGEKQAPTPPPTTTTSGGGGGGGGGGSGCAAGTVYNFQTGRCEPKGQVLGAATTTPELGVTCGLYMNQYLRRSSPKNDAGQVTRLQQFLVKHGYGSFTPTGFFGPLTHAAVNAFQLAYANAILTPWSLTQPTGIVYLTTARQVNLIECPSLVLAMPTLVPWNLNPNAQ